MRFRMCRLLNFFTDQSPDDLLQHGDRAQDSSVSTDTDRLVDRLVGFLGQPTALLKRIPRLSRITVAIKLSSIIENIISKNDFASWSRLLQFPKKCLFRPQRGGRRWKLAQLVNNNVSRELTVTNNDPIPSVHKELDLTLTNLAMPWRF